MAESPTKTSKAKPTDIWVSRFSFLLWDNAHSRSPLRSLSNFQESGKLTRQQRAAVALSTMCVRLGMKGVVRNLGKLAFMAATSS